MTGIDIPPCGSFILIVSGGKKREDFRLMKINEVEQQVGITKRNIRFYEQQGLLSPKRNMENGYRDYTEEEVSELKKIKLLRKLSLPIEEIRRIQNGNLLLEDAMQRQIIVLERERANLAEMSGLCLALSKERCQYPDLSPEQYLERNGTRFSNADKQDVIRKKRGSVIAAGAMILFMIFLILVFVWGYTEDPIPVWLLGFFILIPVVVIVAVILSLMQRIKEIEGGEEDVARKY
jgi:DNA-binding transcriptional MerR regulator